MAQKDFVKQQKFLFWIIGVGLFILLIANALGWIYLQRIKVFFVSDLKFRLENIAGISAKLIDPTDIAYIIPGNTSDPQVIYYQSLLFEIKENNNLQDIYIISPTLEPLIQISTDLAIGEPRRIVEEELIEIAMSGEITTSEMQKLGEHRFLTAVTPLFDTNNMVSSLLVLEVRADFFDLLDQFDRSLLAFSIINAILIITVAWFLFRSIKKVFLLQNLIKNQEHLVKLGEMAASVAHELRNPFGIIKGANSLIEKKYATKKDEIFTYIPTELDRLNTLIEDFLSFARNKEIQFSPVNLNDLLSKIIIGYSNDKNIIINVEVSEDLPLINTDSDTLEQILLNIVKNGVQAMLEKGTITIRCLKKDKNIQIHVTDTGQGIQPELMDKIYDPFYTTRDKGSGLGLSISRRLIEQLNGDIYIDSTIGSGTTVIIEIPL